MGALASIIFSIELFHINYIESFSPHYNNVQLLRVYVLLDPPFFLAWRCNLGDLRSEGLPCPVTNQVGESRFSDPFLKMFKKKNYATLAILRRNVGYSRHLF